MKPYFAAALAFLALLSTSACKLEDILKSVQHAVVKQDPAIAAVFSGKQGLEYAPGQFADYASIPLPRRFNGKNIVVPSALFLPAGVTTRVPVMVILHGDDGLRQHELDYAKMFLGMGVGAMVLDSFTPRLLTSITEDRGAVSTASLTSDATTALSFLATNPHVDMAHIGILGFGKSGGAAISAALRSTIDSTPLKDQVFRLHVAVYPDCSAQNFNITALGNPMFMLLGEADPTADSCQLYARKLKAAGAPVFIKLYPKATHEWDVASAASNPEAQNTANCLFEQQADKSWNEKSSNLTKIANLTGALYHEALAHCVTRGLTQTYDQAQAETALADIKALAQKELFQTQPLLVPHAAPPPVIQEKPKAKPEKHARKHR